MARGSVMDLAAELLDQIGAELVGGVAAAVHGLGGVGKTQLAVEYCYRHGRDYDLVWWVPAEEPGLAVEALARLAERAGVTVSGHAEESACAAVELLRTGGGGRFARWLVVLDNAAASSALDSTMVDELLGAAELGGGHVLITSRDLGWARLAAPVEVNVRTRSKRESVSA